MLAAVDSGPGGCWLVSCRLSPASPLCLLMGQVLPAFPQAGQGALDFKQGAAGQQTVEAWSEGRILGAHKEKRNISGIGERYMFKQVVAPFGPCAGHFLGHYSAGISAGLVFEYIVGLPLNKLIRGMNERAVCESHPPFRASFASPTNTI